MPAPWWGVLEPRTRRGLEAALPEMMRNRRWFAAKHRRIQSAGIEDRFSISAPERVEIAVVNVEYFEGESERYLLPLTSLTDEPARNVERDRPEALLARTSAPSGEGVLVDGSYIGAFGQALLELVAERRRRNGTAASRLVGSLLPGAHEVLAALGAQAPMRVGSAEQSNTTIVAGSHEETQVVMKVFRRLEPGENPELEVGRHLRGRHAPVARLLGAVELERPGLAPTTVAVVHEYVDHESDGWSATVRSAGAFLEQVLPSSESPVLPPVPRQGLAALLEAELPAEVVACLPDLVPSAELLGLRTAELHLALASGTDDAFRPEAITGLTRRSLYQSMRTTARRSLVLLRQRLRHLDAEQEPLAREALEREEEILAVLGGVLDVEGGVRARVHGDLHLGQVLMTGRDVVFVDFEGEPARSFGERRLKRSVLSDVAGMLRSYHYAAHAAVADLVSRGVLEPGAEVAPGATFGAVGGAIPASTPGAEWLGPLSAPQYREAADRFAFWVGAAYLGGYLERIAGSPLLPADPGELSTLLVAHVLDKALYELRYELANRPEWVQLPLYGLRFLLGAQ
ncbi:MAG: putative maltokinase [Actinomycetota bacterium]|nr:putative maltokinase [Actinomycetota bacterium]